MLLRRYFTAIFALSLATCPLSTEALETISKQAILLDARTGTILFEKNADERMPPSSMSKIMTIYRLFDALKSGNLSLNDNFYVSEKAWRKQGSKMFVSVNSRVKVEDLIRGIIVQSGNDASIVVAEGLSGSEGVFTQELNEIAKQLGLNSSNFTNASGWPERDHYTTARDLSKLALATINNFPEYYHYYAEKSFTYNGIKQGNRNPTLYRNIGSDGLKTGHTQAAGYGLTASALRKDRRLVIVLNGLPNTRSRASESERMLDWGFRVFDNYEFFKAGDTVIDASVWMGESSKVPLLILQDLIVTLPKKARKNMKLSAVFNQPVPAPIKKGQKLAILKVEVPGKETQEVPLVSGADVNRLGMILRLGAAIKYILWGETG